MKILQLAVISMNTCL